MLDTKQSLLSLSKYIFRGTVGRWPQAHNYATRFYTFMRVLEPSMRLRIIGLHLVSTLSGLVFLGGSLAIVPFINYVLRPNSVSPESWLGKFQAWSLANLPNIEFLVVLGVVCLVCFILARAAALLGSILSNVINMQIQIYYTSRLYYSYIHRDTHETELSTSEIVTNINSRLPGVIANFVNPIFTIMNNLVFIIAGLSVILWLDPWLMLFGTLGGMLYLYASYAATNRRVRRYSEEADRGNYERHKRLLNSVGAREYIQMTGKQNLFAKSFHEANKLIQRAGFNMSLINLLFAPLSEVLVYIIMVLVVWYVSLGVGGDSITHATIFLIVVYRLLPATTGLFNSYTALRLGVVSYDQFSADLLQSLSQSISYAPHVRQPLKFSQAIQLRDVSFAYPSQETGELALSGINLSIPAGARVGICGSSGGGKTTLLRLITGRIKPSRGTMSVDDKIIKEPKLLRQWQDNIGYVTQNLILLETTLADNIALTVEGEAINEVALQNALDLAQLREMVEQLPERERTQISEAGGNISGGQRQRIVIARALYLDPALLIFDEATSSLDKRTESKIINGINQAWAGQGKTMLFVTHRLDMIKDCDIILMLEGGRITAQGTYEELLENVQFRQLTSEQEKRDQQTEQQAKQHD